MAAAPVGIIGLDRGARVVMWNLGAEEIFGWREAEVLGQEPPFVRPEHREEFVAHLGPEVSGQLVPR